MRELLISSTSMGIGQKPICLGIAFMKCSVLALKFEQKGLKFANRTAFNSRAKFGENLRRPRLAISQEPGNKPAVVLRARRARAMSGRSCSLARSVFFYMSAPSSPAHSGWLAASTPAPRPRAVPLMSDQASCQAGCASGTDGPLGSSACAPSDDGVHRSRRCADAVARVSLPCPATPGSD
jgi:hypothetical protein